MLSQATKNKTYTPKNICSSASKDRSHRECNFMLHERREGGGGLSIMKKILRKKKQLRNNSN